MREDAGDVSEDGGQFEEDGLNVPTGQSCTPPNDASRLEPDSHIDTSVVDAFDVDASGHQISTLSPPQATSKRPVNRRPHINASEASCESGFKIDALSVDSPCYQASTSSPPQAASKRPADRRPNVNSSKANYKKRRAKKRAELAELAGTRLKAVSLLRRDEMSHTRASFDTATGRVASTVWMGHREPPGANPKATYTLEELLTSDTYNFRLERWDGR
jgi:hypothetical protein